MNEPIAKLYDSFNGWLNGRKAHVKAYLEPAKKFMCYSWYKGGSDIGIRDKSKYTPSLFPTTDIQESYKDFLSGQGVEGDPIAQKFQSGNIMADDRDFYIRHASISELMACAFMERNSYDFIESLYKKHIEKVLDLSKRSKEKLEKKR